MKDLDLDAFVVEVVPLRGPEQLPELLRCRVHFEGQMMLLHHVLSLTSSPRAVPPRNASIASWDSGSARASSSARGNGRNGWSEPKITRPRPRDVFMNFTSAGSMYFARYAVVDRYRFGHFSMYWIRSAS